MPGGLPGATAITSRCKGMICGLRFKEVAELAVTISFRTRDFPYDYTFIQPLEDLSRSGSLYAGGVRVQLLSMNLPQRSFHGNAGTGGYAVKTNFTSRRMRPHLCYQMLGDRGPVACRQPEHPPSTGRSVKSGGNYTHTGAARLPPASPQAEQTVPGSIPAHD